MAPPTRRGFGSELIERIVQYELRAKVQRDFSSRGVRCAIEFPLNDRNGYVMMTKGGASQRSVTPA